MPRAAQILAAGSMAAVLLVSSTCTVEPYCVAGDVGCAADRCRNRQKDGDETDVDCGGSCAPCATGGACRAPADCASGRCLEAACCEAPCVVWSRRYGGPGGDRASRAVVLADGSVVLAGVFSDAIDFGGGPKVSKGETDLFVAAFAPSGELRWARQIGGTRHEAQPRLALAPGGHLWLAGDFLSPTVDTGAGVVKGSGANGDLLIVELDEHGQSVQARAFSSHGDGVALVDAVATADGGLIVTGVVGTLDFGDGTVLTATHDPAVGTRDDIFLAKLDAGLSRIWSRTLGDAEDDLPTAIHLDPKGDVVLLASSTTATDYGGPPLPQSGLIVAKYAQQDGAHLWSRAFGVGVDPMRLDVDPEGSIFVAGDLLAEADLGTGKLHPKGIADAVLARLSPDGAPIWVKPVAGTVETHALSVFHSASGGVLAAMRLTGSVDLGDGISTPPGADSLLLVRLDAGGRAEWARNAGGILLEAPVNFADLAGGRVLAYGGFAGTLELGGAAKAAGGSDVFVAELLP